MGRTAKRSIKLIQKLDAAINECSLTFISFCLFFASRPFISGILSTSMQSWFPARIMKKRKVWAGRVRDNRDGVSAISYHGEVPTRINAKRTTKKTVRDDKDYRPRAILGREGTGRVKGRKRKKRLTQISFHYFCRLLREELFFRNRRMIGCPILVHLLFVGADRSGEGREGKPDGFTFSFHTLPFVYPRSKNKRPSVFLHLHLPLLWALSFFLWEIGEVYQGTEEDQQIWKS